MAFMTILFGLVMMVFVSTTLDSCKPSPEELALAEQQDSIHFVNMLKKTFPVVSAETTFDNTSGILREQQIAKDHYSEDSLFRALPEDVLSNVCVTLFRVKSRITVHDVLREYRSYKHVYDNLDLTRAAEEVRKFKKMQEQAAITSFAGISNDSSNIKQ